MFRTLRRTTAAGRAKKSTTSRGSKLKRIVKVVYTHSGLLMVIDHYLIDKRYKGNGQQQLEIGYRNSDDNSEVRSHCTKRGKNV